MRYFIVLLFLTSTCFGQSSYLPLALRVKSDSHFFDQKYRASADSAVVIAAAVLNSQAFKDSLSLYSFPCKNYLSKCRRKCQDCEREIIPTKVILDSLFRLTRDSLTLILNNDGDCNGSFGYSYENEYTITSHFITIDCDDPLPFAYKYAYHICHEYMHIVGFYHYIRPKRRIRNKDIAEQTGWTAYYIIKQWYDQGKKYENL